jgi:hypothetical protein
MTTTTRFDICLAIRYSTFNTGNTLSAFQHNVRDEGIVFGQDCQVVKMGGKRFGRYLFWAKDQATFTKLMKARWNLGALQREEIETLTEKEVAEMEARRAEFASK